MEEFFDAVADGVSDDARGPWFRFVLDFLRDASRVCAHGPHWEMLVSLTPKHVWSSHQQVLPMSYATIAVIQSSVARIELRMRGLR